jgi:membrane-associated phospholipid phosphatase
MTGSGTFSVSFGKLWAISKDAPIYSSLMDDKIQFKGAEWIVSFIIFLMGIFVLSDFFLKPINDFIVLVLYHVIMARTGGGAMGTYYIKKESWKPYLSTCLSIKRKALSISDHHLHLHIGHLSDQFSNATVSIWVSLCS